MILLIAGHDTTASTLTFLWAQLADHPDARARLERELAEVLGGRAPGPQDLRALVYTRALVQESLRMYPPFYLSTRTCLQDDELGGYPIRAGSELLLGTYTLHRHPDFWDEPYAFRPERFLEENRAEHHPFQFLPFGTGPRRCLGDQLGLMKATLTVAALAQRCRLSLEAGTEIVPLGLFTITPKHPIRARIEPRGAPS